MGRQQGLSSIVSNLRNKAPVVEAPVVEEAPPIEPVDASWPPAEPVDDVAPEAAVPDQRAPDAPPEMIEGEVISETVHQEPDEAAAEPPSAPASTELVFAGSREVLAAQRVRLLPRLPEMVHPPAEATPAEQLEHYETIISGADRNLALLQELTYREKVRYIGWAALPIREEELWNKDPERKFESFDDYCKKQLGYGADYVNKCIRALPIIDILRDVTAKELREGPVRALERVYKALGGGLDPKKHTPEEVEAGHQAGAEAVLATWERAEKAGSTSARALVQAAVQLSYLKAGTKETAELAKDPKPDPTPKEWAALWLKPLGDQLATAEPKQLATMIKESRTLLDRYEAQLKERQGAARKKK
ncbi:hypothetical protein [Streptomyces yaizuensis]|nr:hypothetical protein [Streptomyces sp. YSPA8]